MSRACERWETARRFLDRRRCLTPPLRRAKTGYSESANDSRCRDHSSSGIAASASYRLGGLPSRSSRFLAFELNRRPCSTAISPRRVIPASPSSTYDSAYVGLPRRLRSADVSSISRYRVRSVCAYTLLRRKTSASWSLRASGFCGAHSFSSRLPIPSLRKGRT
jgi:hypothetical protein